MQRTVRTSDGRTLAVEEGGDPAGRPVLVHMGTPNSRHLYGPLLHGRHDKFVPFGHGEWLAAHISGVEPRLLDGDGHLTLLENRIPEVHAWLSDRL